MTSSSGSGRKQHMQVAQHSALKTIKHRQASACFRQGQESNPQETRKLYSDNQCVLRQASTYFRLVLELVSSCQEGSVLQILGTCKELHNSAQPGIKPSRE